jgi:hypothetical protein
MNVIQRFKKFYHFLFRNRNFKSSVYWEKRYAKGGNSGVGSYGELAIYKAKFINAFVKREKLNKIIEFGCGDGNQLTLSEYPNYIGLDVSDTALNSCINLFKNDVTKQFYKYVPSSFNLDDSLFQSQLSLSLDVTYHLVETEIYDLYLHHLFDTSTKYVMIYSINCDVPPNETPSHIRYRKFSKWIAINKPNWDEIVYNENKLNSPKGACDFFIYKKR